MMNLIEASALGLVLFHRRGFEADAEAHPVGQLVDRLAASSGASSSQVLFEAVL